MIEPDEAVEVFVSIVMLVIGLTMFLSIQGYDVVTEATILLNVLIQIFIYGFIGLIIFAALKEILG